MTHKIQIVDFPPTCNPFEWQALYIDGELREEKDCISAEDVVRHLGLDYERIQADEDWAMEIVANGEALPVNVDEVKRSRG